MYIWYRTNYLTVRGVIHWKPIATEVWHEAYALGAEIIFWPTQMTTPNFDVQTYARLYRYSIVAAGRPGDIVDVLGRSSNQAQNCSDHLPVVPFHNNTNSGE